MLWASAASANAFGHYLPPCLTNAFRPPPARLPKVSVGRLNGKIIFPRLAIDNRVFLTVVSFEPAAAVRIRKVVECFADPGADEPR